MAKFNILLLRLLGSHWQSYTSHSGIIKRRAIHILKSCTSLHFSMFPLGTFLNEYIVICDHILLNAD